MKVCLVNPSKNQRIQLCEPLNILLLGTILKKQGHTVRIIDQNANPQQDVFKEISGFAPDLAGVTATTTLVNDAYRIGDFCRKNGIRCVIGGAHACALPEEALSHFDLVVKGEGEAALSGIIKDNTKEGIIAGEIVKDLDTLPICDRSLIDMEYYSGLTSRYRVFDFFNPGNKLAQIITMRGCPFRCVYCYNSERKSPLRYISSEKVVEEIAYLVKDYGINSVFFMDDELFYEKKRINEICNLLLEKNIKIQWGGNARAGSLDFDILKVAKEAGCKFLCVGLETGSGRMLEVINKSITVDKMSRGIKICNQLGIKIEGIFMLGYPGETGEDIRNTEKFIMKHKIESIGSAIYTPFPGSALWTYAKNNAKIKYPLDYNKFTFDDVVIGLNEMPVAEIHKYRSRLLIKGYLQPHRFFHLLFRGLKPHNIRRIIFLLFHTLKLQYIRVSPKN